MSPLPSTDCSSPGLTHPSPSNLVISILLFFGILVSYLPQHFRIIKLKTSEGISPFFLFLGVTSGTCALVNVWLLGSGVVGCCRVLGPWKCTAAMLGILQVSMQWACFMVILILFLIYFPIPLTTTESDDDNTKDLSTHPTIGVARTITILCALHFVAIFFVSTFLFLAESTHLLAWANSLGVQATVLASIQYIPQIWTTWQLGHVGSLSIPMMLIQTPGSFIWALSLAAREGTRWSSWLVYVVTGCLQGILLVLCICFEFRERRIRKQDEASLRDRMHEEADEESPLLRNN